MNLADDTAFLDATALADLVHRREVQASELVEAAILRIERLNPQLNAVITTMYDVARDAVARPIPQGPFSGVPFLLKDLIATFGGVRTADGSRLSGDYVAPADSELTARYKRAGLIVVGKTNASEFGILPTTEPLRFGKSRNPWHLDKTTGGSSGGSAAAVASGMVPMAHGNDGGGSIRIPASCCGLFGLKPTRARTPLGPEYGELVGGLVVEHAITRSVRDSAALLDATAGPEAGEPYAAPPPLRPFGDEVRRDPGRLRIAFTAESPNGAPVHADCVRAVEDAAKLCATLGHEVFPRGMSLGNPDWLTSGFLTLWAVGVASSVGEWERKLSRRAVPEDMEPLTWALTEVGRACSAPEWVEARRLLTVVSRSVARLFEDVDVWLTPTLAEPPLSLGMLGEEPGNPLAGYVRAAFFCPFTPLCNITGQPAMSVPLTWNAQGLPIGTQFIGRFGDEATLFRLAAQLEGARPWRCRRPESPESP